LQKLLAALDRGAIAYMIGGSVASSVYGVVRATMDMDLVADIRPAQVAGLAAQLCGEFYADPEMMRGALGAGRAFNVIHFATSYKFDIFPLSQDAYQQTQFSRRAVKEIALGGVTLAVPVAAAEDTLLMKLVWYRLGGEVSERQWNDVRGIIGVQGARLDRAYLAGWADYLKVADLLEAALG
jgi:hypothetical protein